MNHKISLFAMVIAGLLCALSLSALSVSATPSEPSCSWAAAEWNCAANAPRLCDESEPTSLVMSRIYKNSECSDLNFNDRDEFHCNCAPHNDPGPAPVDFTCEDRSLPGSCPYSDEPQYCHNGVFSSLSCSYPFYRTCLPDNLRTYPGAGSIVPVFTCLNKPGSDPKFVCSSNPNGSGRHRIDFPNLVRKCDLTSTAHAGQACQEFIDKLTSDCAGTAKFLCGPRARISDLVLVCAHSSAADCPEGDLWNAACSCPLGECPTSTPKDERIDGTSALKR